MGRRRDGANVGEKDQDSPFIALWDESNHGLEPRLSGKNPLVPPTATLRMR